MGIQTSDVGMKAGWARRAAQEERDHDGHIVMCS